MSYAASIADDDRKLFVGGLPKEATEEDVKSYFEQFGEVSKMTLKMDPITGNSKGFCFIVFAEPSALAQATKQPNHVIKVNRIIDYE